ncbi:MAG TPA: D-2-hydroxyacid dehydrogenase [Chitinophagaceae bacterium]|nr:D-2-hydroxyacid dehydrogenase [Chitinophagaceae bacterium]
MLIYVDTPLREAEKKSVREGISPENDVYFKDELSGDDARLAYIQQADIIFGNPKPEWMKQAKNAKWIQLYSAGFEYYQGIKLPAKITNMQDYYSQPCAETVVAGIMALYRKMDEFAILKEKKQWVGYPIRRKLELLQGKKAIIMGTGNIGRRIARILAGFNAEWIFFGRTAPDAIHTKDELLQKIPWADILIACLPGTDETKGLFTNEMIDLMKPGAIFCNIGRGNLVADQDYLTKALISQKIGGAVLDVTTPEPIPPDSKLWDCPNTILSQHSGGGQLTEYDGIIELFLENFNNYKNGNPLKNPISFNKGY